MRERAYLDGIFGLLLLITANRCEAQVRWKFELGTTVPYNAPMPLSIAQSNQPDIHLTARYSSEPLKVPICWIWRVGCWSERTGWELQAIHQKLFLDNRPPQIQEFSISHGLNVVTLNRTWQLEDYVGRIGAGIALAHPENVVRGLRLPEDQGIFGIGYYVSGPAVIAGIGREFSVIGGLYLMVEAMTTLSYANVPVSDGNAQVWNIALQANFALGYSLGSSSINPRKPGS